MRTENTYDSTLEAIWFPSQYMKCRHGVSVNFAIVLGAESDPTLSP